MGTLWAFRRAEYGLDALYKEFYFYYMDLPDDSLRDEDWELFSQIAEKMDWTADNPGREARQVGWISTDEFPTWLSGFLASHALSA